MTALTVIILAKDEARHITRAIASVQEIATEVVVVDSGSTDDTVTLAKAAGARVLHNPWTNYATQFNWALDQIKSNSGWVLRLDADEIVTTELRAEIQSGLPDVAGITIGRSMCFMGQPIRHGGLFPIRVLRLFRNGMGRCETRWMDEHIIVDGPLAAFSGQIIDDNRNSLDWWTTKHNGYASREVVDILNKEFGFLPQDKLAANATGKQAAIKRWVKDKLYARLPLGARAGVYFLYRYVLRGGFLDGSQARAFHVLQAFWYRYLVDAKLAEVRSYMAKEFVDPVTAIARVLNLNVSTPSLRLSTHANRMKISVVTAVMNGRDTLPAMLESLRIQSHGQIEHIVQDGGSTDGTLAYLQSDGLAQMQLQTRADTGIYDAINHGISRATGDVIGLLNSDDRLAGPDVLAAVADALRDPEIDGVYGDLQYVSRDDATRVIRNWKAGAYEAAKLRRGWMPPHPTLYLRRSVFERAGVYDTSFRISGDYDDMLRYLTTGQVNLAYLPQVMVQMKLGGVSNRTFAHMIRKSREDYRAIKRHNVGRIGPLVTKNTSKLGQFRAGA